MKKVSLSQIWVFRTVNKLAPDPNIVTIRGRTSRNQFKCNCLKNRKLFFKLFIALLKFTSNFTHFEKKKRKASELNYIKHYWLRKTCLLKRLKGYVLEHPSKVNVFTSPKHCWNLNHSTFFLLCHHPIPDWVGKPIS